jgi:hypothetical protein
MSEKQLIIMIGIFSLALMIAFNWKTIQGWFNPSISSSGVNTPGNGWDLEP